MQYSGGLYQKRKRFFFTFFAIVVWLSFPIHIVINYLEGDYLEIGVDLAAILIMAFGYVAIKKMGTDAIVYHICHFLLTLVVFYSVAIGAGRGSVLFYVFAIPPLYFFFFGKKEGLIWVFILLAGLCILMFAPGIVGGHSYDTGVTWRFLLTLSIVTIITYGLASYIYAVGNLLEKKNRALTQEKQHLERALKEIKTLSGFIPICSNCKKIRNDKGRWEHVEVYIRDHSDADFSHSICPECSRILFSQYRGIRDQGKK